MPDGTYLTYYAIAAAPAARAAGAWPQAELAQDHRVAALQDLRVSDPRVGHVRVHSGAAVPAGPRPCMHQPLILRTQKTWVYNTS